MNINKYVHYFLIMLLIANTYMLYLEKKDWFSMLVFTFVTIVEPTIFILILFYLALLAFGFALSEYPFWTFVTMFILGKLVYMSNKKNLNKYTYLP